MYWNLGAFLMLLESLRWITFNKAYFTISKATVWKILILSGFCCWKFKKFTKIGCGTKNWLKHQCIHTWTNVTSYLWNKVVCFVLSCWNFPNHGASCHTLSILRSSWWVWVCQLDWRLFRPIVWKLLII